MVSHGRIHPPGLREPMPEVAKVKIHLPDLKASVERLDDVWNDAQLTDALRSVRFWLEQMERASATKLPNRQTLPTSM